MHFHIDGQGSPAAAVRAALESRGHTYAPSDAQPSGSDALWVMLDGSMVALAQVEQAIRAGWNVALRWPQDVPTRHAERLVVLAEEAGTQVGVIRPLRRLPEMAALLAGDRASILTLAVDLPLHDSDRVDEIVGDLVDLGMALFREAGHQRTEVESTRAAGGSISAIAATIRHMDGSLGQFLVSFGHDPSRFYLVAAGGGVTRRAVSLSPVPMPIGSGTLATDVTGFVQAIARGGTAPVPLVDALEALRIAERICASLR